MNSYSTDRPPIERLSTLRIVVHLAILLLAVGVIYCFPFFTGENTACLGIGEILLQISLLFFSAVFTELADNRAGKTKGINYAILLFTILILIFPDFLFQTRYLAANLLFILGTYQLILLSNRTRMRLHIFLASFFIASAGLFVPEAFFFIASVYLALIFYPEKGLSVWIIPLMGAVAAYIFYLAYVVVSPGEIRFWPEILPNGFLFAGQKERLLRLVLCVIPVGIGAVSYLIHLNSSRGSHREGFIYLFTLLFTLGFALYYFDIPRMGIFLLFPFSVLLSKLGEFSRKKGTVSLLILYLTGIIFYSVFCVF